MSKLRDISLDFPSKIKGRIRKTTRGILFDMYITCHVTSPNIIIISDIC